MSDYAAVGSASTEIKNALRVLECSASDNYAIAAAEAFAEIQEIEDSDEFFLRSAAIVMIHNPRNIDCGVILCSKLLRKALDDCHTWNDIVEIFRYEIEKGTMFLLLKILVNLPPACNFCRLYVLPLARLMPLAFKQAAFKELNKGKNHSIFTLLSRFFVLEKVDSIDYGGMLEKAIESPFLEYGLKASQGERSSVAHALDTCLCEMKKSFPEKLRSADIMKSIKFMLEFNLVEPAANTAVVLWEHLETFEKTAVAIRLSKCLDYGLAAYSDGAVQKGNKIVFSLQGWKWLPYVVDVYMGSYKCEMLLLSHSEPSTRFYLITREARLLSSFEEPSDLQGRKEMYPSRSYTSSIPDRTRRSYTSSFSVLTGAGTAAFHNGNMQGLHNLHRNFNVPNMPGALWSRSTTMNNITSSGLQQASGNLSTGRFVQQPSCWSFTDFSQQCACSFRDGQ